MRSLSPGEPPVLGSRKIPGSRKGPGSVRPGIIADQQSTILLSRQQYTAMQSFPRRRESRKGWMPDQVRHDIILETTIATDWRNRSVRWAGVGLRLRRGIGVRWNGRWAPRARPIFPQRPSPAPARFSTWTSSAWRARGQRSADQRRTLQLAVLTFEIAAFEALNKLDALDPAVIAGHSLGEYGAIDASGALGLEEILTLVRSRARLTRKPSRRAVAPWPPSSA